MFLNSLLLHEILSFCLFTNTFYSKWREGTQFLTYTARLGTLLRKLIVLPHTELTEHKENNLPVLQMEGRYLVSEKIKLSNLSH